MALFKTLKRAFGFSDAELEEAELEGIDATVVPLRKRVDEGGAPTANESQSAVSVATNDASPADESSAAGEAVPSLIFETVVRIFNESLPEFLKTTVDETAQRDYIYQALDSSMKTYIDQLAIDATRRCNERWENERKSMQMQMEALRSKSQKDEADCSDSKKQQLSAERQKRALSERVHELEKQLAGIEAENEQYILENKSLVNKLRLQSVIGADNGGGDVDEALKNKLDELNNELDAAKGAAENYRREIKQLNEALEKSRVKDDVGDAMLTDLNSKVAEATARAAEKERECAERTKELTDLKQQSDALAARYDKLKSETDVVAKQYADLQTRYDAACSEHETLKLAQATLQSDYSKLHLEKESVAAKLREANENLAVVEEMHRQVSQLEESRHANEAFLRKQKDELMKLEEEIKELQKERDEYADTLLKKDETIHVLEDLSDSLRKTIENNLYEHAQSESALRSEIDRLRMIAGRAVSSDVSASSETATDDVTGNLIESSTDFVVEQKVSAPAAGKGRKQGKSKLKISAIDETLEDTDWLIATPPPAKKRETKGDDEPEFGYKEPSRKTTPDNPAQMSLW